MRYALLALIAVAGSGDAAPAPKLPADLSVAAHAYDVAQVKGDRAALQRLLAEDYLLANSAGKTQDKASFIADLTDPASRMDPFTAEQPIARIWRDGAVLGGVARLSGEDHGTRYAVALRFSDVWAKRGGRWQVIYTHASRMP